MGDRRKMQIMGLRRIIRLSKHGQETHKKADELIWQPSIQQGHLQELYLPICFNASCITSFVFQAQYGY